MTWVRVALLAAFALALASAPFLHLRLGAHHTHGDDAVTHAGVDHH
jgi:hypothetical protein